MNIRAACAAILALTLFGGVCLPAHAQSQAKVARSEKLPNVPGKSVTAVVVTFPPGAKSPPHHHAGSVLVYVLSGEVRSENSATGPAKVYKAGETFFEPAGSAHLVSENVSATEPATILAVFIADDGATLTTIDH
jgi:quercetin dioxygenase-like cupin family protein